MPSKAYEQLYGPTLRSMLKVDRSPTGTSSAAFAGTATFGSGVTSLQVVTTAVQTGDLVFTQARNAGATVAITSSSPIDVATIIHNTGFTLATRSQAALDPAVALNIDWWIVRPFG